jgi:hypothetical protein
MARLPVSGSTIATPLRNKEALRIVLAELCPEAEPSKFDVEEFHGRLGEVIGQWSAEQARLDTSPLMRTLAGVRRALEGLTDLLKAQDEGLQDIRDVELVYQLTSLLAENPEVGSRQEAKKLIRRFRRDAATLVQACLVNAQELKQVVGKDGRPRKDWYDDFTALLLEIASEAEVKPGLRKDRVSGEREGWLVDAAQALESFLHKDMRSPSREACGKSLERSIKTLKRRHRQNHPSG